MDFYEMLDQAVELLRNRQRVTYRTLKRQFNLDDTALEDLKEELLFTQRMGFGTSWPWPRCYADGHTRNRTTASEA